MHNNPINRQYSKRLDALHCFLMLMAIFSVSVVWWFGVLPSYLLVGSALFIIYTGLSFRQQHIRLTRDHSIIALELPEVGKEWILIQANSVIQIGQLLPDSLCLPWILLLHFRVMSGGSRFVVLTPFSMKLIAFKGLQRRLRFIKE